MLVALLRPACKATEKGGLPPRPFCHYFVDARVKWVRDACLDGVVEREKNLQSVIALKNLIVSKSAQNFAIDDAARRISLPISTAKFIKKYRSMFRKFQPSAVSRLHVRLTNAAKVLHREETEVHAILGYRVGAAERLAKLLMLTGARKLPLTVIDGFKFDLGLPHNYLVTVLPDFPEYFELCHLKDPSDGREMLGLELLLWRDELAVSAIERMGMGENRVIKKGMKLSFPMEFPSGFDLEKKIKVWVEHWQKLPYISPYENAFHLAPASDQAEKWVVAVLHELLHVLISKKTEKKNLYSLGDYLGFGLSFRKALNHHPGIFYVSNKISTQTVVLREGYKKSLLVAKHPLMAMRYRYIRLMNRSKK